MKKVVIAIIILLIIICGVVFYLYQYTEVFGSKLIPNNINSISIKYFPGYDYSTGLGLNTKEKKVIEEQTINLTNTQIKDAKKYLKKVRKVNSKKELLDKYEIVINKKTIVKMNDKKGIISKDGKDYTIQIPNDTINLFDIYIEDNNKKILKTIEFKSVLFKLEGSVITVNNKDNISYIKDSLYYYPINLDNDYKTYENGYNIEIVFDNKTHLYLYKDSKIAYLENDNSKGYVVLTENIYDLVYEIYKVSTEQ